MNRYIRNELEDVTTITMTATIKNSMFSRNAIVFSWILALRADPSTGKDARKESNPTTGRKTETTNGKVVCIA